MSDDDLSAVDLTLERDGADPLGAVDQMASQKPPPPALSPALDVVKQEKGLNAKHKETSQAGLALSVTLC